jgi:hypothetical protein
MRFGGVIIPPAHLKVHYKTLELVDENGNYLDDNPRRAYNKKFKRLSLSCHPDRNHNGDDKKFKELNNARDALNEYYGN